MCPAQGLRPGGAELPPHPARTPRPTPVWEWERGFSSMNHPLLWQRLCHGTCLPTLLAVGRSRPWAAVQWVLPRDPRTRTPALAQGSSRARRRLLPWDETGQDGTGQPCCK